jgi:hypothetical protein
LLDTYESERFPVGERVMMHSQAQTALMAPGPEVDALRELFGELAGKPDVAKRLADLLHDARPVLIDSFGGAASAVAAAWTDRVDVVTAAIADGPAAVLIRPDGYVAWADTFGTDDADRLRASLARWFGAQDSVARILTVT